MFRHLSLCTFAFLSALVVGAQAQAQDNPEQGDVAVSANTSVSTSRASSPRPMRASSSSSSIRLAMQGRLDAFNVVQLSRPQIGGNVGGLAGDLGRSLMTPAITPGVRLIDSRLFLGLGVGFGSSSWDDNNGNTASQSGFSIVPTATFDLISGPDAALSLGAMFTMAQIGKPEVCGRMGQNTTCVTQNNGAFGMGLSALLGLRGKITESVALGTDFGWGFMKVSGNGNNPDQFVQGLLGMLLLEASLGL